MRKILLTLVAAGSIAAATFAAPTRADAGCRGCWIGAGVAAGVFAGAAIANAGYYGGYNPGAYYSGYGPYQPAYYGGYQPAYYYGGYRPVYNYGYRAVPALLRLRPARLCAVLRAPLRLRLLPSGALRLRLVIVKVRDRAARNREAPGLELAITAITQRSRCLQRDLFARADDYPFSRR